MIRFRPSTRLRWGSKMTLFLPGRSRFGHSLLTGAMLLSLLCSPRLTAQVTTGTLYGDVHDTTGAVVPGASVVAKHQETGFTKEGVTDEKGEFAFTALPTGPYTITIGLRGFKTLTTQGLELGAGQTVRQTFNMEVGALAETITVAIRPLWSQRLPRRSRNRSAERR
jgi:hypothetical protein